jgi:hypothetical protein
MRSTRGRTGWRTRGLGSGEGRLGPPAVEDLGEGVYFVVGDEAVLHAFAVAADEGAGAPAFGKLAQDQDGVLWGLAVKASRWVAWRVDRLLYAPR